MTVELFFFNVEIIFYDEKLLKKKKKKKKNYVQDDSITLVLRMHCIPYPIGLVRVKVSLSCNVANFSCRLPVLRLHLF